MSKNKKFITCDGNYAASYIAYMFSEVACIYPITPSSTMAEYIDEWAANGKKNIFGETVKVEEMQSEAGASGAVHGALQAGALSSTYTCSQGLLLMIPNMYKMAGELLPAVFHVSARAVAAHALSIFGDHSDVYATRQTGFALLASSSVQQIIDLAGVAHLSAIKSRIPFLHFFDGFRSSAEIQKIEAPEMEDMIKLLDMDAVQQFRMRALNPDHPVTRGTAQNPDIFFQAKEAVNKFYDAIPDTVENYMQEITKLTGREYHPFTYYGPKDAENIIVAMGSVCDTIRETVDYINQGNDKVGLITCHLYRPFSSKYFFNVLPSTVKKITVLDRAKEPGANGDPLYLDVRDLFYERENRPLIIGGRYGLSSKDTDPAQIVSVFNNMRQKEPKNHFTVGIVDDVTFTSLPVLPCISVAAKGTYEAKFWGIGADGTVGANKNSIKIIGETTDKYCQAYFAYDSKKSGGVTTSHLRFGNNPIRSPYLVNLPDFVACHVPSYLGKYDLLKGLKKNGTFLLNSIWDVEETLKRLPDDIKKYMAEKNINFYIINATKIAVEIGLGNRTNSIMQSAFFKVSNVIPYEDAIKEMKNAILKTYGNKGENIVKMNYAAVDKGGNVTKVELPAEWSKIVIKDEVDNRDIPDFIKNVVEPINAMKGDSLPVSAFLGREDGTFPQGTAAYEKRAIAVDVPEWLPENCTQCNQCSFVCPHSCIRPFLINEQEAKNMPAGTTVLKALPQKLFAGLDYRIQVSTLDCTGCGNCYDTCPGTKNVKALVMNPLESQNAEIEKWNYFSKKVTYKNTIVPRTQSIKNSQFSQPLYEFSGACSGCGETPYVKLISQLYGERMMIANATGCSSIWGGSAPSTPYTINAQGKGPSWGNSLFEDNAEYGFGMNVAVTKMRSRIEEKMTAAMTLGEASTLRPETIELFKQWIEFKENADKSVEVTEKLLPILESEVKKAPASSFQLLTSILDLKQYLIKKSMWIIGGDGWAYDIGYGGLDHVIASGQDVNILVLDTEVYSNTGGQASKSTPVAAVAKFASAGKRIRKKDLGMMAMSYGYVYVAQINSGASQSQTLKAIREAEAYKGPSIIIAYSPCINHGLKAGMEKAQDEGAKATECGYWHNYRYNPMLEAEGKNPFLLDSPEPKWDLFQNFLNGEVRYTTLKKSFPKEAEELFKAAEENAKWRYNSYKRLAAMNFTEEKLEVPSN